MSPTSQQGSKHGLALPQKATQLHHTMSRVSKPCVCQTCVQGVWYCEAAACAARPHDTRQRLLPRRHTHTDWRHNTHHTMRK